MEHYGTLRNIMEFYGEIWQRGMEEAAAITIAPLLKTGKMRPNNPARP